MVLAVDEQRPHVDRRVAGEHAGLERGLDALIGDVLRGTRPPVILSTNSYRGPSARA